jgi:ATP-dependent Lon protease
MSNSNSKITLNSQIDETKMSSSQQKLTKKPNTNKNESNNKKNTKNDKKTEKAKVEKKKTDKLVKEEVSPRRRKYASSDEEDDDDDDDDDETFCSEDIEDTETEEESTDEDDDYETVSDDDEDEEEDTEEDEPPKTPKKSSRKKIIESEDEDEEDEEKISKYEIRKTISEIFPSKYMKDRVEKTKNESNKQEKKDTKKKKQTKEPETEDDSDDEDYHPNEKKSGGGVYSIMLSLDGDDDEYDTEEDEYKCDENEECDSDDEKKFMKEKYEHYEIPEDVEKKEREEKRQRERENRRNKKNDSKTKKSKKTELPAEVELTNIDEEYTKLLNKKKQLIENLKKDPTDTVLREAVEKYNTNIKKLIRKSRNNNAKAYHKLIHSGKKPINEIDYFKKNLSNSEQLTVMNDLKSMNKLIHQEKPYRLMLLESNIPPKFKAIAFQKLNALKYMEPGDSEYFKIKFWIDNFMKIPFGIYNSLSVNIDDGVDVCHNFMEKSMATLDECVYGLKEAKIQIMQLVGQWISNPSSIGTAIAIHGPPGCGKTSLVKDGISKILGREFAFIALGGAGDSSFLEGHSYTYEGSTCGRIVQILQESKCMNPVIYFDELDKISETPRGEEIANVLTHLTDTTQNNEFHDKYFAEFDFDISKCLFIFSYNDESKVNPILKDRMYRIQTKGYEVKDKIIIARNYLLPKIREHVKFSEKDIVISDDIIQYLVSNRKFTKEEAGVRNLKRCLEIIFTKLNLFRLTKPDTNIFGKEIDLKVEFPFVVTRTSLDALIKGEENQNQSLLAMYV